MAPVEREDTLDRAISRFDDAVSKFREVGSALAAVEGELHISAVQAGLCGGGVMSLARPAALFGGYGSRCGVWVQAHNNITRTQSLTSFLNKTSYSK